MRTTGGVYREVEGEDCDFGDLAASGCIVRLEARASGRGAWGRLVVAGDDVVAVHPLDVRIEPIGLVHIFEVERA